MLFSSNHHPIRPPPSSGPSGHGRHAQWCAQSAEDRLRVSRRRRGEGTARRRTVGWREWHRLVAQGRRLRRGSFRVSETRGIGRDRGPEEFVWHSDITWIHMEHGFTSAHVFRLGAFHCVVSLNTVPPGSEHRRSERDARRSQRDASVPRVRCAASPPGGPLDKPGEDGGAVGAFGTSKACVFFFFFFSGWWLR